MSEISDKLKLNTVLDELTSSKFIIAEKYIQQLLSLIAVTPSLYDIIEQGSKSQGYSDLFSEAISNVNEFKLPSSKRQLVTLVTGLLYEFDDKTLPIVEFITHFFPSESGNESFALFCSSVLIPYKKAFNDLLENNPETEAQKDFNVNSVPIPLKAKEEAEFWINNLLDVAYGDNTLTPELRNDYIILLKGLLYVIELENSVLARIVWTGIKNSLWYYKKGVREIKELESVLKGFGIID